MKEGGINISYRVHTMTKALGREHIRQFREYGIIYFKCGKGEKEELGGSGKP